MREEVSIFRARIRKEISVSNFNAKNRKEQVENILFRFSGLEFERIKLKKRSSISKSSREVMFA
jgi:hypothetical protein